MILAEWTPELLTALIVAIIAALGLFAKPFLELLKKAPERGSTSDSAVTKIKQAAEFAKLEQRVKQVKEQLAGLSGRFTEHVKDGQERFSEIKAALATIETKLENVKQLLDELRDK